MTYDEAIAFIHGAYGLGEKHGLENTRRLLEKLDNPQERFASVHVAGTNGKGSVCALVHAALRRAGLRTGLYTSPFLQRYNERMRVNGVPIPDDTLAALTETVAEAVEELRPEGVKPTVFEIGTAIAFLYFARANVDIAVVEVGLGGRLDPTNVLMPRVSAIVSIGLDHTRVLGDTAEAIAREKAGIAKPGVPMVLSGQTGESVRQVVRAACVAKGAPLTIARALAEDIPLGLEGAHQRYNAGVAATILEQLMNLGFPMEDTHIRQGLARARWPGRLEWVAGEPPLLLDGAHNPQGAQALAGHVKSLERRRTVLLCGMLRDKDWRPIAETLASFAEEAVTVAPEDRRALDAQTLADTFTGLGLQARAAASLPEALEAAKAAAGSSGRVVVAGSLYLVGEVRTALGLNGGILEIAPIMEEE